MDEVKKRQPRYESRHYASETKRQCAGYPGHECKRLITDYRCYKCWQHVRGGSERYTGDEYGGISLTHGRR